MISHPHNPSLCGVNEETQSHCNAVCPQQTKGWVETPQCPQRPKLYKAYTTKTNRSSQNVAHNQIIYENVVILLSFYVFCLSTYKVMNGMAPQYLGPFVRVADLPGWRALRSAVTNHLTLPAVKLSTNQLPEEITLAHLCLPSNVTSRHSYLENHFRTLLLIDTLVDRVVILNYLGQFCLIAWLILFYYSEQGWPMLIQKHWRILIRTLWWLVWLMIRVYYNL